MMINPPTFQETKVDVDAQEFIDEVFKVVYTMEVTSREKAEGVVYQVKEVAQVWLDKWRDERHVRSGPVDWGVFKTTIHNRFSYLEEKNLVDS